jgi:hypothetical protein
VLLHRIFIPLKVNGTRYAFLSHVQLNGEKMNTHQIETINQSLKSLFSTQSGEIQQCIENCLNCHRACEQLLPYCLEKGGMHSERKHIELLLSCSDICRTSAHLMMWNSDQHAKVCGVCADICTACAVNCEQMGEDRNMSACAELCRRCAESCSSMVH